MITVSLFCIISVITTSFIPTNILNAFFRLNCSYFVISLSSIYPLRVILLTFSLSTIMPLSLLSSVLFKCYHFFLSVCASLDVISLSLFSMSLCLVFVSSHGMLSYYFSSCILIFFHSIFCFLILIIASFFILISRILIAFIIT